MADLPRIGIMAWLKLLRHRKHWLTILAFVALSLIAGRVAVEMMGPPLRIRWIGLHIVISGALGLGLGCTVSSRVHVRWPALIPALYLFWPWPEPTFAALLCGLTVLLIIPKYTAPPSWPELVIASLFLGVYLFTLSPGLLPADSGEFQLVAATLGIAHPPGYALYTMLGKLVTLVPLANPARCLNAFSALVAAATLLVLMRSIRSRGGSLVAALAPALMLGLATTYWAQATTANIRSLMALFTALCLATLLRWEQTRDDRWLTGFALCFGLGVGHHASLGLLGPPFLAFILVTDWRLLRQPSRWPIPVATLVATFLVWLYLPIRSAMNPAFDPSPIRGWTGFWQHVLALGFGGDMFRYRTWDVLQPRISVWLEIMRLEFGTLLSLLCAGAAAVIGRWRWRVAVLMVGAWFMNTLAAVTYRAPQTVEYLMPSYVAMAFALGLALVEIEHALGSRRMASTALGLILCIVAVLPAAENWRSFAALSHDDATRETAQAMLDAAPENALVLSSWHRATPMWYLQLVEKKRPDVTVSYVYPEGGTPNAEVWLRRIRQGLARGPVVVTNRYHAFADADLVWSPLASGWQVTRQPLADLAASAAHHQIQFGSEIALLGYELEKDTIQPGDVIDVRAYWTPQTDLEIGYTSFCQVVGPQGVIGQSDLHHQAAAYSLRQVCVDQFQFPVLTHATPGEYQLILGFYHVQDGAVQRLKTDSGDHAVLATISLAPTQERPVTLHPRRERWSGDLELVGVDFDKSVAGQTRLYLHWHQAAEIEQGTLTQVRVVSGGLPVAMAGMPDLPKGAYQTMALDVPSEIEAVELLVLDDDIPRARLGPWNRDLRKGLRISIPEGEERFIPLGGEMALVQTGLPNQFTAGDEVWCKPQLLALKPLTNDDSVSVGLLGQAGWESKSDGTPALGAIPTLKWVRGWQVTDPRRISVPDGTAGQHATVTLSVYDAFTLAPVPILDERLVRQGQGVTLQLGQVTIAP